MRQSKVENFKSQGPRKKGDKRSQQKGDSAHGHGRPRLAIVEATGGDNFVSVGNFQSKRKRLSLFALKAAPSWVLRHPRISRENACF
jgi:hypothetical protein